MTIHLPETEGTILDTDALDQVEVAIEAIAAGEMVVVVDDMDRENEGDLIMAAEHATSEKIGFMIRHTSGIICVPMRTKRAEALRFDPMVSHNSDSMGTAFTVSVDYLPGLTTGISATERAATIRAAASSDVRPHDFTRPGHVFPLVAREGGVLVRSGHTEAGVDLAELAGLQPVAALAEIVDDSGEPMRLTALRRFALQHGLKIISIEDLISYRLKSQTMIRRVAEDRVRMGSSDGIAVGYRTQLDDTEHLALVFGDIAGTTSVLTCIHCEQPLADMIDRRSIDAAIQAIEAEGCGVMILIRSPSAMMSPARLSQSQDAESHQSAVARNRRWRDHGIGAQILRDLGISSIAVTSASPESHVELAGFGIDAVDSSNL